MIMNPFQVAIENYFQRITDLQESLFHIDSVLNRDYWRISKLVLDSKTDGKDIFGLASRLVISDITGPTDNGWELNYSTGFKKIVRFETLRTELDSLISREAGFMIAQAHEAFETYLKTQIASAFYILKIQSKLKEFKDINIDTIETCSEFIWSGKFKKGRNNEILFKSLREICPFYRDHETHNNLGTNLYDLYYIYAELRHAVTHSEFIIKNFRFKSLTPSQQKILLSLKITDPTDSGYKIVLDKSRGDNVLKRFSEIAFTIFKGFSVETGEDWKIFKTKMP